MAYSLAAFLSGETCRGDLGSWGEAGTGGLAPSAPHEPSLAQPGCSVAIGDGRAAGAGGQVASPGCTCGQPGITVSWPPQGRAGKHPADPQDHSVRVGAPSVPWAPSCPSSRPQPVFPSCTAPGFLHAFPPAPAPWPHMHHTLQSGTALPRPALAQKAGLCPHCPKLFLVWALQPLPFHREETVRLAFPELPGSSRPFAS